MIFRSVARQLPFTPVEEVWRKYPWIAKDKVRYMVVSTQAAFGAGVLFTFMFTNRPDFEDNEGQWESPLRRWALGRLIKSGKLDENLRVKRTEFYDPRPDGVVDPLVNLERFAKTSDHHSDA